MARVPVIAGNWKMYKTQQEAIELLMKLMEMNETVSDREIVVCPPFPFLGLAHQAVSHSNIKLGAQNCYFEKEGAYTGEVSVSMLKSVKCSHVIIGHSERRQFFGETDESVNKKIKAALAEGLTPIVCIGETLAEREEGRMMQVIKTQVEGGFSGLHKEEMQKLIIAYEPIWAIGTGKTATPEQAEEVHAYIRKLLADGWYGETSESIRILYGGSVKPENIDDLMEKLNIDGALVGGASLKAESFTRIIQFQAKKGSN
ncbi:MAG: triose-phosphate isomerase [Candidatus Saganbacteria bacterium]|nr:triose-phosphate isomerase [Candidatus Saganbacteria bacterium]